MNKLDVMEVYPHFVRNLAKPMGSIQNDYMHGAIGVCGEAGELGDQVKKFWCYNKPLDQENIKEELGDLYFYMQMIMNLSGFTLQDVLQYNVDKLCKRYPEGYSDAAAQARADKKAGD